MSPTRTTIEAVVLGKHPTGEVVTVTGRAEQIVRKHDPAGPWVTFLLLSPDTGIRVAVEPVPYGIYRDLLADVPYVTASGRAPVLTVLGIVDTDVRVPELIAVEIRAGAR